VADLTVAILPPLSSGWHGVRGFIASLRGGAGILMPFCGPSWIILTPAPEIFSLWGLFHLSQCLFTQEGSG